MKQKIMFGICFLLVQALNAQLYLSTGSTLTVNGNAVLTLRNTDLVNHGSFSPGLGVVHFTGDKSTTISGSQYTAFNRIVINKASIDSLRLLRNVFIAHSIDFLSGHIDLNGKILDLGIAGILNGEKESSRIVGLGGGYVVVSAALNNPAGANPGNLGAVLSSGANLGNVLIRRGHRSQNNTYGLGYSIQRYYEIIPANNTNLNATFRFSYFNSELNGIPENSLKIWNSADTIHWSNQGYTSGDPDLNYLEKQGISSFTTRWTLSDANNPLPVTFTSFNLQCLSGPVLLNWQTAQEQNSDHFRIERSANSINWAEAGRIKAAGFSQSEKKYSFTDLTSANNRYYRIVQVDKDGREFSSNILRSSCNGKEPTRVWPNPFTNTIYVTLYQPHAGELVLLLRDDAGRLLKKQVQQLPAGVSQLAIQTRYLPKGIYWLTVYNSHEDNGEMFRLIRQ